MSKQDRQGVRTPAGLDQKYNLGGRFSKLEEQDAKQSREMNQQNFTFAEFVSFVSAALIRLEKEISSLKEQVQRSDKDLSEKLTETRRDVTNINISIGGINESLMRYDQRLEGIQQDAMAKESKILEVETTLSDHTTRLETAEQNIVELQEEVSALTSA